MCSEQRYGSGQRHHSARLAFSSITSRRLRASSMTGRGLFVASVSNVLLAGIPIIGTLRLPTHQFAEALGQNLVAPIFYWFFNAPFLLLMATPWFWSSTNDVAKIARLIAEVGAVTNCVSFFYYFVFLGLFIHAQDFPRTGVGGFCSWVLWAGLRACVPTVVVAVLARWWPNKQG